VLKQGFSFHWLGQPGASSPGGVSAKIFYTRIMSVLQRIIIVADASQGLGAKMKMPGSFQSLQRLGKAGEVASILLETAEFMTRKVLHTNGGQHTGR
jgi:hypothetical protein